MYVELEAIGAASAEARVRRILAVSCSITILRTKELLNCGDNACFSVLLSVFTSVVF